MVDAQIVVRLDSLARAPESGRVTAEVWLSVEGRDFPEPRWGDFAVVVLTWWVHALIRIRSGQSNVERVHFMDGPYFVEVEQLDYSRWAVKFVEDRRSGATVVWNGVARPDTLVSSVITSASRILIACRGKGWESGELSDLSDAARVLRAGNLGLGSPSPRADD